MPNHVLNELVFHDLSGQEIDKIVSMVGTEGRPVDFSVLVPQPINIWKGGVGKRHKEIFNDNALNWNRRNWGTKWNAYGLSETKYNPIMVGDDGTLIITFQTAWRPPMDWIIALYNSAKRAFVHNWLDEGAEFGHTDQFICPPEKDWMAEEWVEGRADEETDRRLRFLLWGDVESENIPGVAEE
jgi:hypothetical protein